MGFPEALASAALSISGGNTAAAIEYLSDPPESSAAALPSGGDTTTHSTTEEGEGSLESLNRLRQHPDYDQLRLMVQQDPGSLQRVLAVIGQQDPGLLAAIHSNQVTQFVFSHISHSPTCFSVYFFSLMYCPDALLLHRLNLSR